MNWSPIGTIAKPFLSKTTSDRILIAKNTGIPVVCDKYTIRCEASARVITACFVEGTNDMFNNTTSEEAFILQTLDSFVVRTPHDLIELDKLHEAHAEGRCRVVDMRGKPYVYVEEDLNDVPYDNRNPFPEVKKVKFHLARAKKVGLAATLTLDEWISTLDHYLWVCAYCAHQPYEVFEHFLPLFHGGGTTFTNCVPACTRCNARKGDLHPAYLEGLEEFADMAISDVRRSLEYNASTQLKRGK